MGYTPPMLLVNKVASGWSLSAPSSATGDDLTIYANSTDTYPQVVIEGAGRLRLRSGTGEVVGIYTGAIEQFWLYGSGTDSFVECKLNNNDIYLKTLGTGVVKFGTYTAGAATDSTGYITIKDAAGNTRKLMVQA